MPHPTSWTRAGHASLTRGPGVARRLYGLLTSYRRTVVMGLLLIGRMVAELYLPPI